MRPAGASGADLPRSPPTPQLAGPSGEELGGGGGLLYSRVGVTTTGDKSRSHNRNWGGGDTRAHARITVTGNWYREEPRIYLSSSGLMRVLVREKTIQITDVEGPQQQQEGKEERSHDQNFK